MCGLSLLLVWFLFRGFFLWVLRFPLSTKTNISKFKFDLKTVNKEPLCGCANEIFPICLFIYYYLLKYRVYSGTFNLNNMRIKKDSSPLKLLGSVSSLGPFNFVCLFVCFFLLDNFLDIYLYWRDHQACF